MLKCLFAWSVTFDDSDSNFSSKHGRGGCLNPSYPTIKNLKPYSVRKIRRCVHLLNKFRKVSSSIIMHAAIKLQNPELRYIHFHTLRHWYATMPYHKTQNILYIMQKLGHKNIKNTLIYTHLVNFESDEYPSTVAKTAEEARKADRSRVRICLHHSQRFDAVQKKKISTR